MVLGSKHSFWQALIAALFIFWIGILIGVIFENSRVNDLEDVYFDSETDIFDFELASEIIYDSNMSCDITKEKSIYFADKVYEEAIKLEKYDDSNKITSELVSLHRRYDLLRTVLWKNIIDSKKKCDEEINTVVYLYEYKDPSLNIQGVQGTMSNYLIDLKKEYGDDIVLIPIAIDTDIDSLDMLREYYELQEYPVIFVNEKEKFEELDDLDGIRDVLN